MRKFSIRLLVAFFCALVVSLANGVRVQAQSGSDLPDYMNVIVGNAASMAKAQVAEQNVLALDLAMFGLYDDAQAKFQKNFLAQHPVIMALFSNEGGKLTL